MNFSFKSLLAALILLCSTVATAHDFEVGGIFYNITSSTEKTVEVTYKGCSYDAYSNEYTGDVTVPSTVAYNGNTYSVTSIGDRAFYDCDGLTSVTIGDGVTSIGNYALSRCDGLTSIEIPGSVTSIGEYAFFFCYGLTNIEIPGSVTSIGKYAFSECFGLTSVTIGDGVTSIGEYALSNCSGLTSIEIPGSVTSIGKYAFYGCRGLTSVTSLATTAPGLDYDVFYDISSDATLYYPAGSDYSSWAQYFANTEEFEIAEQPIYFSYYNGLPGSMQGNNHVWESGKISLSRATNGIRITVFATNSPDSYNGFPIVALGELEFYNANGEKIDYTAADVTTNSLESSEGSLEGLCDGDYSTFYHSTWRDGTNPTDYVYVDVRFAQPLDAVNIKIVGRNTERLVPTHIGITSSGVYCPYLGTEGSCGDNARWSIENGVLTISGTGAIWDYYLDNSLPWPLDEITYVIIEDGVTSIGNRAFSRCSGLMSVTIGDGVTSIGDGAFQYCSGLKSVTIGDGVTSIGGWAFYNCYGLTSIEIPGCVTSIGGWAFYNCYGLTSIEIPGCVTSIGGWAFYNCYGLTSIEIPGSVTSIGDRAFRYCSALTSIVVDGSNRHYDSREGCNAIIETATNTLIQGCKNTIIPGSVTGIGDHAFLNCHGLTSIEIPGSVTSIGNSAFYGCDGLTSVTIGDGVTSIGESAFECCSGLTSIEIPGSVTSIGGYAFSYCPGLTSVTSLATTAPALGSAVFSDISSGATLYYPAGSDYSSWAQYFANTEEITEEFPEEEEVFGDLNGDGTVSVSDIQVLVNIILGN